MNRRRIILVAVLIVTIALIGVAAYLLLGNRSGAGSEVDGNLPEIGGNVDIEGQDSDVSVVEATIPVTNVSAYRAFAGDVVIAVHRDGTIDRVASSTLTGLSNKPIENFASASFSGDGSRILVLTGNQPRTQVNIFEVASASWRVIPGTFRDAVWAPTGNQLATLTPDAVTGKTAVGIYDAATGKTVRTVAVLALGDVSISWPNSKTIIVSDKPNRNSAGSSWAIDVASGRVTVAARGKLGYAAHWDSSAQLALAFQANVYGTGGRTKLIAGGVEQALLSFTTIPDKCTFFDMPGSGSSTTPFVICGVPREQEELQRWNLPDAYYRKELFTDDVLIGVNLDTRTVDFTIGPPLRVDATKLQVLGTTVYYLDRRSGALYKNDI